MRLSGWHALVTGEPSTIGRALRVAFKNERARVTALDRPGLQPPDDVATLLIDLEDLEGAARAAAEGGPSDILINNVAVILNEPHEASSLAKFEEQVRADASAPFSLARAVAPRMRAQRWGEPSA